MLRNDLTGIGQYSESADILTLGASSDLTTFYGMQLKFLKVRSVTDSTEVVSKLNEWFSRDSYVLAPEDAAGILGTGIWDDAAYESDQDYYNDGV